MKTFHDLSAEQQQAAVNKVLAQDLEAILCGALRFNDSLNGDDLQSRIDAAIQEADRMRTPWYAHEYILDTCREELEGMARCAAEDAIYPEAGEFVIKGIAA